MFKVSKYIVKSEIPSQNNIKDIAIFSTRTGNMIVIKKDIVDNLYKAYF